MPSATTTSSAVDEPIDRALHDHVPTLEALLGREDMLGLDVTTVIPELTMVPHAPALAALLPRHEASMAGAHHRARELAATIAGGTTAPAISTAR
ncbi:hypothetical protein [Nocardia sp. BMG51109]|uniref:hypothetical protein n=1 Tax=Nocardia sp. BMG51109 TaxID=1056816 RepID=UPI00046449F3|nr:hypothetical protein [Nocardia sp. BMG51109]